MAILDFLGRMLVVMLLSICFHGREPVWWPEEEETESPVCEECVMASVKQVKTEAILIVTPRMAARDVQPNIILRLLNPSPDMYCPAIEWSIYPKQGNNVGDRAYFAKEESDCAPWEEWLDGKPPPKDIVWGHHPRILLPVGVNWLIVAELRQGRKMLRATGEILMVGE